MSASDGIPHVTRVTWCQTHGQYADEHLCADEVHDHYDLALNTETGEVLWRVDPVGTTYLLPGGDTLRLTKYDDEVWSDPMIEDHLIPRYDYWSSTGGAASMNPGAVYNVWQGAVLAPGVVRTVVLPGDRPALGSVYVRPNGEAWRLRDYRPDFAADWAKVIPSWIVNTPRGGTTNGETLPDDARLVWAP